MRVRDRPEPAGGVWREGRRADSQGGSIGIGCENELVWTCMDVNRSIYLYIYNIYIYIYIYTI